MNRYIVVVESGWVFVGDRTVQKSQTILTDAACIRRWGTTKGLGELASSGATSQTILDPIHTVEIPNNKILFTIPVLESARGL